MKERRFCKSCEGELLSRYKVKFCSNLCQSNFEQSFFISLWKNGQVSGTIGISTRGVSAYVKRYLYEKGNGRCSICGWDKVNVITKRVPLEMDHIDGNSENNSEANLRLICPNCHSLTSTYKNLNKGKGRKWRMDKYIKNS